jgi:hypothetical protein
MHITETRSGRSTKVRKQVKSSKHVKIIFKVLKKYKVDRKLVLPERVQVVEPIKRTAYEDSSMPATVKAFLEASNRKRPSWITQTPVKKVQTEEYPSEKDQSEENVYCECRRPYSPGELMFKCEGFCEQWYHPECMKMKPEEVERQTTSNERWYCPSCIYQAQMIVLNTNSKLSYKKAKNNF